MAASNLIRLRRTLTAFSSFHRSFSSSGFTSAPPISLAIRRALPSAPTAPAPWLSRSFRSSSISLWSNRSSSASNIPDEIGPDDILFEGCDYHHWLFVMDFPKDNKPSPEEMVRTYEETCAKGLGISLEEAKQKIYACSTTTYTGFQAVMSEEESKKFESIPGVIFVLPDSYIDPVNKEYGGDKYINGTIIPRPPPIQYGRNTGRRPRQDNQMPNRQGNPSYNNRGPMQGDGRNYGPSQNYPPQQNYGQRERRDPVPRDSDQLDDTFTPSYMKDFKPSYMQEFENFEQGNYPPKEQAGSQQRNPPPGVGNFTGEGRY
ncbi:hypothetical protein PIB30_003864 [Stylosanthes scabra]|uniref:MORF/ORRM1/DAG-like MORF domain-containing protein n=1 Tax=Stylosanthes scabra TaxID=79078 RepID=A0ABU6T3R3_9FABA|nr:hypothetical protein [Stylosanthes scabra]